MNKNIDIKCTSIKGKRITFRISDYKENIAIQYHAGFFEIGKHYGMVFNDKSIIIFYDPPHCIMMSQAHMF